MKTLRHLLSLQAPIKFAAYTIKFAAYTIKFAPIKCL